MNSLSTSSSELEVINLDNAVIGILSDDPMFATGLKSILKRLRLWGRAQSLILIELNLSW